MRCLHVRVRASTPCRRCTHTHLAILRREHTGERAARQRAKWQERERERRGRERGGREREEGKRERRERDILSKEAFIETY